MTATDAIIINADGTEATIQGDTSTTEISSTLLPYQSTLKTVIFKNELNIVGAQGSDGVFENFTALERIVSFDGKPVHFVPSTGATTASLYRAFGSCTKLARIDGLSSWDVSNVSGNSAMRNMFASCSALTDISALSGWDVSNLSGDQCMMMMFNFCYSLVSLDALSGWDVSNVSGENCMSGMFMGCPLTSLDGLSSWDVSNVSGNSAMRNMFASCSALTDISALSGWDISNAIASNIGVQDMFTGCSNLSNITLGTFKLDSSMSIPSTFNQGGTDWYYDADTDKTSGMDTNAMITASADTATYGTHWQRAYSVTFDSNGGSFVAPEQVPLNAPAAITAPTAPTKTGYTFLGWYAEDDKAYDFSQVVNTSFTLNAKWDPINPRTATWNLNATDAIWADTSTVTRSTTAPEGLYVPSPLTTGEASPSRTGYTFKGWGSSSTATEPSYISGMTTFGTSDVSYYAIWEANTYTYTFADTLNRTTTTLSKKFGETITQADVAKPTYTGDTFVYWKAPNKTTYAYTSDGKLSIPVNIAEDTTFTSVWRSQQQALTLQVAPGHFANGAQEMIVYKDMASEIDLSELYLATYDGYHQTGWKLEDGTVLPNTYVVPTSPVTLIAIWEKDPEPTPEPTPSDTGWHEDETGWQYTDKNGELVHGWLDLCGTWYYFDEAGYAVHDMWLWNEDFGPHWYYFWSDCSMAANAWIWDGAWYWVCSSGPMIQGLWQWIDGAWYGFWWNGAMCQGWVWDNDYVAWFYCFDNGVLARNMWFDGYYFIDSGICLI